MNIYSQQGKGSPNNPESVSNQKDWRDTQDHLLDYWSGAEAEVRRWSATQSRMLTQHHIHKQSGYGHLGLAGQEPEGIWRTAGLVTNQLDRLARQSLPFVLVSVCVCGSLCVPDEGGGSSE